MRNYAGIADFVGPLAEAMKEYRAGNPDSAQNRIKQINDLMDAYETQQSARYKSAQAYNIEQLTPEEVLYKRAQTGERETAGLKNVEMGNLYKEEATTEKDMRQPTIEYKTQQGAVQAATVPLREQQTKTSQAQEDVARSKIVPEEDLKFIIQNDPELQKVFSVVEKPTYAQLKAFLEIQESRAMTDGRVANAEKARKSIEELDQRISLSKAREAAIESGGTGGVGGGLKEIDRGRGFKNDEIQRYLDLGYNYTEATALMESGLTVKEIQGFINTINTQIPYVMGDAAEKQRLLESRAYYVDLLEKRRNPITKAPNAKTTNKETKIAFEIWDPMSDEEKAQALIEQKKKGVNRVTLTQNGKQVFVYNLLPNGQWTGVNLPNTTTGQASVKEGAPQKVTQQGAAVKQGARVGGYAINSDDDFNSAINTIISKGGKKSAYNFVGNNQAELMKRFGWTKEDIKAIMDNLR